MRKARKLFQVGFSITTICTASREWKSDQCWFNSERRYLSSAETIDFPTVALLPLCICFPNNVTGFSCHHPSIQSGLYASLRNTKRSADTSTCSRKLRADGSFLFCRFDHKRAMFENTTAGLFLSVRVITHCHNEKYG